MGRDEGTAPTRDQSIVDAAEVGEDIGDADALKLGPVRMFGPQHCGIADSLAATLSIQNRLPSGVVELAQSAFVTGLNGAAIVATFIAIALVILSVVALRHIGASQAVDAAR